MLLLIAVVCVHCVVSKLRSSASVFEKERLIKIHALLYSLQFLFYLAFTVSSASSRRAESNEQYCKDLIWIITSGGLYNIIASIVFILVTYMSVQFSKPIGSDWQQFLLGYRDKSLDAFLNQVSKPRSE